MSEKLLHAKLSASGSSTWMACPGSIKAYDDYVEKFGKPKSNVYAIEGICAHALADKCIKEDKEVEDFIGLQFTFDVDTEKHTHIITDEMAKYVREYIDYVLSYQTEDSELYAEERVDFSNIVPDGFGTNDAAIVIPSERTCHIFDLKYGYEWVEAFENTQEQLYALGFLNDIGWLWDIDTFVLHICQPRVNNFSSWTISRADLVLFAEYARERALLALTDSAPRVPGTKQCRWCVAKDDCPALEKYTFEIIGAEFDDLDDIKMPNSDGIPDERKIAIIDNKELITQFINAIEQNFYLRLMAGEDIKGVKLQEGKSNRQFVEDAEETLRMLLGPKAYKQPAPKMIGITDAEKELGWKVMKQITVKPKGKLTMVRDTDGKPGVKVKAVADEFDNLDEGDL